MVIKVYRNWMRVWEPCREEWERYRHILSPLCVCGSLGFKRKEDLVLFLADHNIEAVEENEVISDAYEQLILF